MTKTKNIRRRDYRKFGFLGLAIFVAVFLFMFLAQRFGKLEDNTSAANLSNFQAGYIISDFQMTDYNSMSEVDIQNFLWSKGRCYNTDFRSVGTRVDYFSDSTPPTTWHVSNGHTVCLAEENMRGESAAHIIWQAAQDYHINPKVLIVLIQKETGLITDPIPNSWDYQRTAGYGCPDTAACSEKYYGFKNQIRNAASLFRIVMDGNSSYYPIGYNNVRYSPNPDCGSSVVYIKNLATSALYRYTPYQPNAGALAAGYGTAPCGAYGNRNFYAYFEDWFGGVTLESAYEPFVTPRYMTLNRDVDRINPFTGEKYDTLEKGRVLRYTTKIRRAEGWYYRSEACTIGGIDAVVPASALDNFSYEPFVTPRYMVLKRDIKRINPFTGEEYDSLEKGRMLKYATKIKRADGWYYRSEACTVGGMDAVVPADALEETAYELFITPRHMILNREVKEINPFTGEELGTLKKGQVLKYSTKIRRGDRWYYRSEANTKDILDVVVPADALEDFSYEPFITPRYMTLTRDVKRVNLFTGGEYDTLEKGRILKYTTKIRGVDGWYYRSEDSTKDGTDAVVPADALEEISYEPFITPREMTLKRDVDRINPFTGEKYDTLKRGLTLKYTTKIRRADGWYYRSETCTNVGIDAVVPADALE